MGTPVTLGKIGQSRLRRACCGGPCQGLNAKGSKHRYRRELSSNLPRAGVRLSEVRPGNVWSARNGRQVPAGHGGQDVGLVADQDEDVPA